MELPPYRVPTAKSVLKHMWLNTAQYIKKIAGVVLVATMIIWALGYFPRKENFTRNYDLEITQLREQRSGETNDYIQDSLIDNEINYALLQKKSEQQRSSYIGELGRFLQPIMSPLGFDWKMTCAIIAGIPAKEVVVGTLGVLFPPEAGSEDQNISERIRNQKHLSGPHKGESLFTPLIALSFMLFILIYFPCVGVIAAIKKESGKWKYAIFEIVYTTGLAWIVSFLVFQIGSLLF